MVVSETTVAGSVGVMATIMDEARRYIALGLPIIPVCPPTHNGMNQSHRDRCKAPGKVPLIKGWQTKDKTTEQELKDWLSAFKEFNIGLPLGDVSGYVGIDVDGDIGVQLLMQMSGGVLPSTWEFSTAAGSRLLYKIPPGLQTKKFKQVGEGVHEECAILCSGQQTVMPPSVHATGYVYAWVEVHSPTDMDCGLAPDWLIELITADADDIDSLIRSRRTSTGTQVAGMSWEDEFASVPGLVGTSEAGVSMGNEFSLDLPTDALAPTSKGRGRGGSKKKLTPAELDALMTRTIGEGERDNIMTQIIGHYCSNRDLRRLGKDHLMEICLNHNQKYCDPPLERNAIISKVNYFLSTEQMKDQAYAERKGRTGGGRGDKAELEPMVAVQNLLRYLKEEEGLELYFDQFSKAYYYARYDQGPWICQRDYNVIRKWIRNVLVSEKYGDPSWDRYSMVEEVRRAVEEYFTEQFKEVSDFDLGAHQAELGGYVVLNNGVYDWVENILRPWSIEYKTTIAFDIDYDPTADCPNFEQYLEDWLPDESVRMVLQEFLGLCLIPNTNFRKAIFLYGKGRNGKSVLIEFLQRFFGRHSSTLSYDGLFTRFGPSALKDKLVNIFDDTTVTFTKETSVAKNLIAGGRISAEFKGRDAFDFVNTARLIFSSQETPRTADTTLAWYDRWFFIQFPNTFRASNQVKLKITEDLEKEIPGIFNWMMVGLRRLIAQDGFSASAILDRRSLEYRASNDSVMLFLQNLCASIEDNYLTRVSVNALYRVYQHWAQAEALRPVSKKIFILRVEDAGYEMKRGRVRNKNGQNYFECLAFNSGADDYQEYLLEIQLALTS